MRKRAAQRALLFGAIVGAGFVAILALRRGPSRSSVLPRTPAAGAAPTEDAAPGEALVEDARRYAVRTWSFALDRYEMRIEDAAMTTALDAVLARIGANLVVNGGFFDPDGKPVGLAMSDGVVLSKLGPNLGGGVLTSDGRRIELAPAETFSPPDGGRFAIQCRPRLVVDRAANVKSDDRKRAERTALCVRASGSVIDVVVVRRSDDGESPGPSLFGLARYLVEIGCESALNLDGGPSTGVAWREADKVRLLAPRGPVRHVISFRERR